MLLEASQAEMNQLKKLIQNKFPEMAEYDEKAMNHSFHFSTFGDKDYLTMVFGVPTMNLGVSANQSTLSQATDGPLVKAKDIEKESVQVIKDIEDIVSEFCISNGIPYTMNHGDVERRFFNTDEFTKDPDTYPFIFYVLFLDNKFLEGPVLKKELGSSYDRGASSKARDVVNYFYEMITHPKYINIGKRITEGYSRVRPVDVFRWMKFFINRVDKNHVFLKDVEADITEFFEHLKRSGLYNKHSRFPSVYTHPAIKILKKKDVYNWENWNDIKNDYDTKKEVKKLHKELRTPDEKFSKIHSFFNKSWYVDEVEDIKKAYLSGDIKKAEKLSLKRIEDGIKEDPFADHRASAYYGPLTFAIEFFKENPERAAEL